MNWRSVHEPPGCIDPSSRKELSMTKSFFPAFPRPRTFIARIDQREREVELGWVPKPSAAVESTPKQTGVS